MIEVSRSTHTRPHTRSLSLSLSLSLSRTLSINTCYARYTRYASTLHRSHLRSQVHGTRGDRQALRCLCPHRSRPFRRALCRGDHGILLPRSNALQQKGLYHICKSLLTQCTFALASRCLVRDTLTKYSGHPYTAVFVSNAFSPNFPSRHRSFTSTPLHIQDEDGSGEVDFREFVTSLWNYCTVGPHALSIFAFDMYDCDSSGTIDKDEIRLMLKEVYGDEFDRNEFAHRILAYV